MRNPWLLAFLLGIACITLIRPLLRREPAPPPVLSRLPDWTLVDSSGAAFGSADLRGKVWVASLFSTRGGDVSAMASLQRRYADSGIEDVRLVSITVDPSFDTPQRLREYGAHHGVDPQRWSLLTGGEAQVRTLVDGIAQPERLVLVDRTGSVRGYYGTGPEGLDEVFHRSRHVLDEQR